MQTERRKEVAWDTITIRRLRAMSSCMRASLLARNARSPTESTSSSTRISGSREVAIAKPSRERMPFE